LGIIVWNKNSIEYQSLVDWSKRIKVGLVRESTIVLESIERDDELPIRELSNGHKYLTHWNNGKFEISMIGSSGGKIWGYWEKGIWSGKDVTFPIKVSEPTIRINIPPRSKKRMKVHTMIEEICYQYNVRDFQSIMIPIYYIGAIRWKKPTHPFFQW
jgi:hypothetical protein